MIYLGFMHFYPDLQYAPDGIEREPHDFPFVIPAQAHRR
jgi:hypothetical protein